MHHRHIRASNLFFGGLILVSLLFLHDHLTSARHETLQTIAVIAFAIALPLLVCTLVMHHDALERQTRVKSDEWAMLITFLGVGSALIGITVTLWLLSWIAALVFVISTVFALVVYSGTLEPVTPPKRPHDR